jgi:hypothetical protein
VVKARWEDVLDVQLDIHNFMISEGGSRFGAGWFYANYKDPRLEAFNRDMPTERVAIEEGVRWARWTGVEVFNAEPIYVDPDMMTVIEAAIAGFHGEPLVETDLITRQGLLVLPRSLWLRPTREDAVALNWSVAFWKVVGQRVMLALFHDQTDPDELDGVQDVKAAAAVMRARQETRYLPTHVVNWDFGEMHPGWSERLGHEDAQVQVQAIWRLLNQTLAVHSRERPPRQFLRRARKMKLPNEHVTIVRLRRPSTDHEPGDPVIVNWTHRWVVGGHWRNQPYPSLGLHRQIWISPYVKGPEELPLIVNKARIFALVR